MELKPTISALLTRIGFHYVDVWREDDSVTLEVYLPPEDGVQSRAELKVQLRPDERLSLGEGVFVYEATKNAVVLQYWSGDQTDEAIHVVKSQLLALDAYVNLQPYHRKTRKQLKSEFASYTEALFGYISALTAKDLASS